jgi:hypothetical protein
VCHYTVGDVQHSSHPDLCCQQLCFPHLLSGLAQSSSSSSSSSSIAGVAVRDRSSGSHPDLTVNIYTCCVDLTRRQVPAAAAAAAAAPAAALWEGQCSWLCVLCAVDPYCCTAANNFHMCMQVTRRWALRRSHNFVQRQGGLDCGHFPFWFKLVSTAVAVFPSCRWRYKWD